MVTPRYPRKLLQAVTRCKIAQDFHELRDKNHGTFPPPKALIVVNPANYGWFGQAAMQRASVASFSSSVRTAVACVEYWLLPTSATFVSALPYRSKMHFKYLILNDKVSSKILQFVMAPW